MARILIIDDDPAMVSVISDICQERGHQNVASASGQKALDNLATHSPQLVISDLRMDKVGGLDILRECREVLPQTPVILITAYKTVETAIGAMKLGAYDYITKPFKVDELQLTIQRALDNQTLVRENRNLRQIVKEKYRFENIIGTSGRMQEIYNLIAKVADTDSTILIQGESGTGKELVARALHFNSSRQHHPFVTINCSALPDNLLESELFGHKKGAFAGAVMDKVGLYEEGNNGTLFLDEIDSMSQPLQTKLLMVLQERQIRQVGDAGQIPVNVRPIAASNESLKAKTRNGEFREDLYFRLAVIPIEVPPLRERIEDVPLLVRCFLEKLADQTGTEQKKMDANAMERLVGYCWPGNVRELENAIERAYMLSDGGVIRVSDLPPHILHESAVLEKTAESEWRVGQQLDDFVRNQERKYIEMTLKFNEGSREKTASMLGISIATLYRKLDLKHHRG